MDEVQVERFLPPLEEQGKLIVEYDSQLAFHDAGWTSSTLGSPFGNAMIGSDITGLYIDTPATVSQIPAQLDYGAWSLYPESTGVIFEPDRLYRCVYTLQSSDTRTLGHIRLINANRNADWGSVLVLVPDNDQHIMPHENGSKYSNWFESMNELYTGEESNKNRMTFLFDLADGKNFQMGTVYLTKVELYSYDIP